MIDTTTLLPQLLQLPHDCGNYKEREAPNEGKEYQDVAIVRCWLEPEEDLHDKAGGDIDLNALEDIIDHEP